MKTTENNKIIAEFMGAKITDIQGLQKPIYYPIMGKSVYEHKLKYHSSWDWLIPTVMKCLEICQKEMLNEWEEGFSDSFFSKDINCMYSETLRFIKWYNKQKNVSNSKKSAL